MMDILNFLFVYIISGLILSLVIKHLLRESFDTKLSFLLGYGISPLLISLLLYYLYLFFPGKEWRFYVFIIYSIFVILLLIFLKQIKILFSMNIKKITFLILNKIKKINVFSKIIVIFILSIVLFSFVRGIIYPNTWIDNFIYLRQGYVYSYDRSLDRLETRVPFSEFNNNIIAPPEQSFIMNTAVRPALPILYSFFFKDKIISEFEYFSVRFIYFYYFLLSIFALYYFLKKNKARALIGVLAFVSCYYVVAFTIVFNSKEIILTFLSFFSVMLISLIKERDAFAKLKYAIIIGILIGLSIFINTSGIIIGGILILLFLKEIGITKKVWPLILTTTLLIVVFSSFEIKGLYKFILNKNLLSTQNTTATFNSSELQNYKITSISNTSTINNQPANASKLSILILGKLQGLTQVQFYGFLFIIFLITLVRTLKNHSLNSVTKNVLLYMGLFFFIIMDPFFLNPHKYAYVLSISPKYTVLLTIFAAFFIAYHFNNLIKIQEIKNRKLFFLISSCLLFFVSIISLISPFRKILANISYSFFLSKIIPLYNDADYYIKILNNFILTLSILYIRLVA